MKLAFICAGDIQVPPPAWGAVEILVWEYYNNLLDLGIHPHIYNSKNLSWVKSEIEKNNFDLVHLQHEDLLPYLHDVKTKKLAVTSHCGWAENYEHYYPYYWKTFKHILNGNHYIFALSEQIKNNYLNFGFDSNKAFITKNGVNTQNYRVTNTPKYHDRSLYLGKIEFRKRQYLVSDKNLNIDFAGFGDTLNLSSTNKLLGQWTKDKVYNETTEYANLILLSISEAHALVCMEALASGLGLVISEKSTANLDLTKKFITVIPEEKINDLQYLKEKIESNREYSINNRKEIVEYAKSFDWKIVTKEYLETVQKVIN